MRTGTDVAPALRALARLHGVQIGYEDATGVWREPDEEALLAVLRAAGATIDGAEDAEDAVRGRRLELHRRRVPPVLVAWETEPLALTLRRSPAQAERPARIGIALEGGGPSARPPAAVERIGGGALELEGDVRIVDRVRVRLDAPAGYHRLIVDGEVAARVLVAPERMHPGAAALREGRAWGVFAPVHAIRRKGDDGAGDLDALAELFEVVAGLGGHAVGTLPLLAQFLDEPFDPSPYSPVSRLFWSELWLGGRAAPAEPARGVGRGAWETAGGPSERNTADGLVDYRAVAARRREALEREAEAAWADGKPAIVAELERLRPDVGDYARFRATTERRGAVWHEWPERLRRGNLEPGDWDERSCRYHLYAQARLHERLSDLAATTRERGAGLYVDLPLGAHPDGYDAWRYQKRFARGVSVGAPPDALFTGGQDWGFPPLRPDRMLEHWLEYTTAVVRNHLRYAGVLRLDHVMGLHRQFWVPRGMAATRGVYVRYPSRALWAVLAIESHRRGAAIVGENLGTVPDGVRAAMRRHGARGMYVGQYEAWPGREPVVGEPAAGDVASLNTHDMPPFAAYWTGRDLRQRVEWGLLTAPAAAEEEARRAELRRDVAEELDVAEDDVDGARRAWQERLASSDAGLVLVNLEDLWNETKPQNVPGTGPELPNWRRRAATPLERVRRSGTMQEELEVIDRLRRGKAS